MAKKPVPSSKPRRPTGGSHEARTRVFEQMAVHGLVTARSVSRLFAGSVYNASWWLEKMRGLGDVSRIKLAVERTDRPLLCYTRKAFDDTKELLDAYMVLHFCQIQPVKRTLLNHEQFERLTQKLGTTSGSARPKYRPCYVCRTHRRQIRLALVRVFASPDQDQVIAGAEDFVGHPAFRSWRVAVQSGQVQLTLLVPEKSEVVGELRRRFQRRPLLSRVLANKPVVIPVRVYSGIRPVLDKTKAP